MKPFLLVLLVVAFATPSWAEPLRLNLSRSQTLNLPQPPAQRDSLVNGIVIGAIVGALWCGFVCAKIAIKCLSQFSRVRGWGASSAEPSTRTTCAGRASLSV